MNYINADIPPFYCLLRREYLYNLEEHHGEYEDVTVFGIRSLGGRAIAFHVLTSVGAVFSGLPISSLCWSKNAPYRPLHMLELWDCFGENVSVHEFDYLKHSANRCKVLLKDKSMIEGNYMFTVDWCKNPYSEEPSMNKCAHVIKLEDGNYAAQPNNRILWFDPCNVVNTLKSRPDYKVNTHVFKCETEAKWVTSPDDKFFYNISYDSCSKDTSLTKQSNEGDSYGNYSRPAPS